MSPHQPIPSLAHRDRSAQAWRERRRPLILAAAPDSCRHRCPVRECCSAPVRECHCPLKLYVWTWAASCIVWTWRARPSATAPGLGCSATLEVGSNWFEVSWLDNFNIVPFHSILHWSNFFISCVLIPSLILLGLERRRVWIRMMNSINL